MQIIITNSSKQHVSSLLGHHQAYKTVELVKVHSVVFTCIVIICNCYLYCCVKTVLINTLLPSLLRIPKMFFIHNTRHLTIPSRHLISVSAHMLILWTRDLGRPIVVQLLKIFRVSYGYGRFVTIFVTSATGHME